MEQRSLPKLFFWIRDLGDLVSGGVECFFNTAIEDGMENVFFAFEVKIDSAIGDAGFARDIGDLRIEVTTMREDTDRSPQNSFTFISQRPSGSHRMNDA